MVGLQLSGQNNPHLLLTAERLNQEAISAAINLSIPGDVRHGGDLEGDNPGGVAADPRNRQRMLPAELD